MLSKVVVGSLAPLIRTESCENLKTWKSCDLRFANDAIPAALRHKNSRVFMNRHAE
jgi:hypothetical protein